MSSPSSFSLLSSRPSSRASVSSSSTTQDRKPRIMHSGRGGSGNYRKHKPTASMSSTSSISSTLASASDSILLSDTASSISSSVFTMSSGASSISTAPTSLLSAPGTLSSSLSMCSTTLSFKTFLSDDDVILANGREAAIEAPTARSGRGGLGSHKKIIEKVKSLNELDPVRNPHASALMEEFHQNVAARERALLVQSQLEYDSRVHIGRMGHGNLIKENVIKPSRQKKRSSSIDSPRSALSFRSANSSNIRELIESMDNITLGSTTVTPSDSNSASKARRRVKMRQMLKKLAKRRGGAGKDNSPDVAVTQQMQTKGDSEVPIIIIGDVHHSDDSDAESEVVFRTNSILSDC